MASAKKMATKKNVTKKPVQEIMQQPIQENIIVSAKAEDLCGAYANIAVFKHTKREFVADFIWRMDNANMLVSRIITSPQHAKAIHKALGINIENYEKEYGKINDD